MWIRSFDRERGKKKKRYSHAIPLDTSPVATAHVHAAISDIDIIYRPRLLLVEGSRLMPTETSGLGPWEKKRIVMKWNTFWDVGVSVEEDNTKACNSSCSDNNTQSSQYAMQNIGWQNQANWTTIAWSGILACENRLHRKQTLILKPEVSGWGETMTPQFCVAPITDRYPGCFPAGPK